jgi:hypothetical protein
MKTEENDEHLDSLEIEMIALNEKDRCSIPETYQGLSNLNRFRDAMLDIMKRIYQLATNFTNVQLVGSDLLLFTHILPKEFAARNLSYPYIFTNFLDWREICRSKYDCVGKTVQDAAR